MTPRWASRHHEAEVLVDRHFLMGRLRASPPVSHKRHLRDDGASEGEVEHYEHRSWLDFINDELVSPDEWLHAASFDNERIEESAPSQWRLPGDSTFGWPSADVAFSLLISRGHHWTKSEEIFQLTAVRVPFRRHPLMGIEDIFGKDR